MMKYKRISDFPKASAEEVEVFARSNTGANVRVPYDIKQEEGDSTTSLMSQGATTQAIRQAFSRVLGKNIPIGEDIMGSDGKVVINRGDFVSQAFQTLLEKIENIDTKDIPDGSITEVKLAEDVRVKLNHDNGYWFVLDIETPTSTTPASVVISRTSTPTNTSTTYTRTFNH